MHPLNSIFILLRSLPQLECERFLSRSRAAAAGGWRAPVAAPAPQQAHRLRLFNFSRRALSFLRSVAILLQMHGAALPAWWLVGVSTVELALLALAWRWLAAAAEVRWEGGSALFLVAVFIFTHGAGVGCLARPGGCGDLGWLGAVLILVNAALLVVLACRPCRACCVELCTKVEAGPETPANIASTPGGRRFYVKHCCKLAVSDSRMDGAAPGGPPSHAGGAFPLTVRVAPPKGATT